MKNVTKGDVEIKHSESKTAFNIVGTVLGGKYKIARFPYNDFGKGLETVTDNDKAEANSNALLYLDAHNTFQSCSLSPSELKQQRDELLEALIKCEELIKNSPFRDKVIELIKMCNGTR